ncbi:MAG: hypothetical protein KDJ65_40305, partial [Anaerolineae bacterium]|nr:hypothetical protein [Anaerolineae bacterium]
RLAAARRQCQYNHCDNKNSFQHDILLLLVVEHNAAKPHPKLEHRLGGSNRNNRVSLISKYADVAQNRRRKTITFLTTFLPVLSMFMKSFLEKAERMLRDCWWVGGMV